MSQPNSPVKRSGEVMEQSGSSPSKIPRNAGSFVEAANYDVLVMRGTEEVLKVPFYSMWPMLRDGLWELQRKTRTFHNQWRSEAAVHYMEVMAKESNSRKVAFDKMLAANAKLRGEKQVLLEKLEEVARRDLMNLDLALEDEDPMETVSQPVMVLIQPRSLKDLCEDCIQKAKDEPAKIVV